ncbi:MAG: type II secretion system protein GspE, partial [Actinobacteria bacterium]|nr:type II secretion system protein GspE [Actinomycetota bacterium]
MKQLGDILVTQGLISSEQLDKALLEQRNVGHSLGRVLIDLGMLTEAQVVQALATQIGMRFVDLTEVTLDGAALSKVPGSVCRRHSAIPIGFENGRLVVAMSDPANVFAVDDIRSASGMTVVPVVATRTDVQAALDRHYRADGELDELTTAIDTDDDEEDL